MKKYLPLITLLLFFVSCQQKKNTLPYYGADDETSSDSNSGEVADELPDYEEMSSQIISVPFTIKGGVKYVEVKVNGFGFPMIFDSGCSSTLISLAEARYLYEKGYLTNDDVLGVSQSQIADGSIVENMVVNLREVIIGNAIRCTDVQATVSDNTNSPLLLGNEVLDRAAAYAVDNENQCINFKLR